MLASLIRRSAIFCMAVALAASLAVAYGPSPSAAASKPHASQSAKPDDAAQRARALKLHREAIVIDTHNDITSPMVDDNFDLGTSGINADGTLKTHTDIQRM